MTKQNEDQIFDSFTAALANAEQFETPYRHWFLDGLLPAETLEALHQMDFPVANLDGVSGKRELHNDTRHYVDQENMARLPVSMPLAGLSRRRKWPGRSKSFSALTLLARFCELNMRRTLQAFGLSPIPISASSV